MNDPKIIDFHVKNVNGFYNNTDELNFLACQKVAEGMVMQYTRLPPSALVKITPIVGQIIFSPKGPKLWPKPVALG